MLFVIVAYKIQKRPIALWSKHMNEEKDKAIHYRKAPYPYPIPLPHTCVYELNLALVMAAAHSYTRPFSQSLVGEQTLVVPAS